MTCEFAHLDGSYVLGALAPTERLDFERHLTRCADCSRSVRELAGIPGLLAQVDLADLEASTAPALPTSLLPSLVREVRGAQRRRSVAVAAVAAAVAAVAVGAIAVAGGLGVGGEQTALPSPTAAATTRPPGTPMVAVGPTPVRAEVLVAGVAWGTRLDLTCSYTADEDDAEYEASPSAQYALVVTTADGRTEQVATWNGLPGRTMRVSGATATSRGDIRTVEMRTADGIVVLRLSV
ncbi:MAG TPA: zf-HC2 domain-containing protein [Ornithinibacter sp.]|nr:zf-HC2 domain-containing protein [Ornithinibacter sp.]